MKPLLKASQITGNTVFTNVLQDPRQPALPFYPQLPSHPVRSLLWPWTPSALAASTARNTLPSPPAVINSAVRLFLISLLKCAFCLLLSISPPCFTFLYGVYLLPCTNYTFYLFILLTVTPHRKWKFHEGRNVGWSHFHFLCGGTRMNGASLVAQMVKESACNAGDLGAIPGLRRSPEKWNGNPLQYSCLENFIDRLAKSWTRLSD